MKLTPAYLHSISSKRVIPLIMDILHAFALSLSPPPFFMFVIVLTLKNVHTLLNIYLNKDSINNCMFYSFFFLSSISIYYLRHEVCVLFFVVDHLDLLFTCTLYNCFSNHSATLCKIPKEKCAIKRIIITTSHTNSQRLAV